MGAWAIWTAWRGEPRLFALLLRSAEAAVGTEKATIEVKLKQAAETFDGSEDWLEHATTESMSSFDSMKIDATGPKGTIHIDVLYMRVDAYPAAPAVVVKASRPELIEAINPLLQRGNLARVRPVTGTNDADLKPTLKRRVRKRFRMLEFPYAAVVLALGAGAFFAAPAPDESELGPYLHWGLLAISGVIALLAFAALIAVAFPMDKLPWFQRLRRTIHRRIFPAIDIHQQTPGRRLFRVALGALGPLVGVVLKQLFEAA
jgi:hypothetical protein